MSQEKNTSTLRIPPSFTGVAGEYFVAAELSRRGYIASISLRNARGIDILATNQAGSRSITIQCKTSQDRLNSWMLTEKSEQFFAPNHFYVFVGLGKPNERPGFHIIPSTTVAKYITKSHRRYLQTFRKDGKRHADTSMRRFEDPNNEYLERWDLLGL
ncbi:MAG: hypothetical protein PHY43_01020 [Verrucomicrobiales bacterium]|nr:hypothetical protein [Verrucomicrobiales bacterium]